MAKFYTRIDLDVYIKSSKFDDYEVPSVVDISFDVDEEWRSWGLKSMYLIPQGTVTFPLTIITYTDDSNNIEKEVEITIPLDDMAVSCETIPATLRSLDVELDENLKVVFKKLS